MDSSTKKIDVATIKDVINERLQWEQDFLICQFMGGNASHDCWKLKATFSISGKGYMLQQFPSNTFCHKSAIMGQKSDIYTSLIYLAGPNYITGQRCTVEILHSNFAFISGSLHNLEARGAFHETACCVVSSAERNQIQPKYNSSKHFTLIWSWFCQ